MVSVACATWECPILVPPLRGIHTPDAGVRAAVGDTASPLGAVAIVDAASRTPLADALVGDVWLSVSDASAISRGPTVSPLLWLWDPERRERRGPYKATGAAP